MSVRREQAPVGRAMIALDFLDPPFIGPAEKLARPMGDAFGQRCGSRIINVPTCAAEHNIYLSTSEHAK